MLEKKPCPLHRRKMGESSEREEMQETCASNSPVSIHILESLSHISCFESSFDQHEFQAVGTKRTRSKFGSRQRVYWLEIIEPVKFYLLENSVLVFVDQIEYCLQGVLWADVISWLFHLTYNACSRSIIPQIHWTNHAHTKQFCYEMEFFKYCSWPPRPSRRTS